MTLVIDASYAVRESGAGNRVHEPRRRARWAKTYDAEYLALAELLGCRVLTVDSRLRRGTDRLGLAVLPTEL